MAIRNVVQLSEALDSQLSWRRRELLNIKSAALSARDFLRPHLFRSGYLVAYAHWEGFVKFASHAYLEYVSRQNLRYAQLKGNFVAIACRKAIREAGLSQKGLLYNQVVDFIMNNLDDQARLPYSGIVDTESNLNYAVFENIQLTLGVGRDEIFENNRNFIDREILKNRNSIAHGEFNQISECQFLEAIEKIDAFLLRFKSLIENSAVTGNFKA